MTSPGMADIDRREPWQRAYRHGAFFVFPPPEVSEHVDALPAEHDPISHAFCQADAVPNAAFTFERIVSLPLGA